MAFNRDKNAFGYYGQYAESKGLTKKEYFAGLAMQGLLTRLPDRQNKETDLGVIESQRIAEESVIMADKLLKQLENDTNI